MYPQKIIESFFLYSTERKTFLLNQINTDLKAEPQNLAIIKGLD